MLTFILRRLGTMVLTMLCLTLVVFFMVNLEPNLRKLSISQLDMRSSDEHIESWLVKNGRIDKVRKMLSRSAEPDEVRSMLEDLAATGTEEKPAPLFSFGARVVLELPWREP